MTYERPRIEQRAAIGGALIGLPIGSVPLSPTWRRPAYERPAVERRDHIGGPLIGVPVGSIPASPTWRREEAS